MINCLKARTSHIEGIHKLINGMAQEDRLLPLSRREIGERLRDFHLAIDPDTQEVQGCCALHLFNENLGEIRSLAVHPKHARKGIGTQLAEKCIEEAKEIGLQSIFALSRQESFFTKLGFQIIDRDILPEKVFRDCLFCSKFHHCDEKAYSKNLKTSDND